MMKISIIFAGILITLFVLSFISRRRFGQLALAMAAGSMISKIWSYDVGVVASIAGLKSSNYFDAIISCGLILLPSGLLMLGGYKARNKFIRFFGSILFAVLAFTFMIDILGSLWVLSGQDLALFNLFYLNKNYIIGSCLVLAVFDMFIAKPEVKIDKKRSEH